MSQPSFWCIANLGDVDPFEHGGQFLCVDRTGVYPPELVVIEAPASDDDEERFKYVIQVEPLTAIKDDSGEIVSLSDNRFHVLHRAWFADAGSLQEVARCTGTVFSLFVTRLLSSDPVDRAFAYKAISDHFGYENFDSSADYISADKAKVMCDRFLEQIEESKSWHQGYFNT